MSYFQFGVGGLFFVPAGGNQAANPSVVQGGTVQDTSMDIDQKLVELRGQNKFPDDVAPGDMTIKGKTGMAKLDMTFWNYLMFADAITTGASIIQPNESHTLSTSTVTITPPGSGSFNSDMGVLYANGQPFTRLTIGTPTAGQYTVSAGVYTFSSADVTAAATVLISYLYNETGGKVLTVTNHLQGYGPIFAMYLTQPYQGNNSIYLHACRASKMSIPEKRDGYVISDFEYTAYPDANGNVLTWYQG